MKNSKIRLAAFLSSLLAILKTKAVSLLVAVIIALIILFAGWYIIQIITKTIHKVLPSPPATTNEVAFQWQEGYLLPMASSNAPVQSASENSRLSGFTFQYGISSANLSAPWLVTGAPFPPHITKSHPEGGEAVLYFENDSNAFDFLYVFYVNDYAGNYYAILGRSTYTASNDTETGGNLNVIVQYSPDLTPGSWKPLFTNSFVELDGVYTFTDTNTPSSNGFYRVSY